MASTEYVGGLLTQVKGGESQIAGLYDAMSECCFSFCYILSFVMLAV